MSPMGRARISAETNCANLVDNSERLSPSEIAAGIHLL
jgi:hypothetical protein